MFVDYIAEQLKISTILDVRVLLGLRSAEGMNYFRINFLMLFYHTIGHKKWCRHQQLHFWLSTLSASKLQSFSLRPMADIPKSFMLLDKQPLYYPLQIDYLASQWIYNDRLKVGWIFELKKVHLITFPFENITNKLKRDWI